MKKTIIPFMVAWVATTAAIFICNHTHFVPVAVPPPATQAEEPIAGTQQGIANYPGVLPETAATGTTISLWLHGSTNLHEPLTEFQVSSNELAAAYQTLRDLSPEAHEWMTMTDAQRMEFLNQSMGHYQPFDPEIDQ